MTDRKRYSRRREGELWKAVDSAITELRIKVLKGNLECLSNSRQEEILYKELGSLADKVCAEYRRSYAAKTTEAPQ